MRILVTGSHGVIGSALVPRLTELGHKCIGFDIRRDPNMDVRSWHSVDEWFRRSVPDLCIHMAAQVSRLSGEDDPENSVVSNMVGTLNVVRACLKYNVRLVNFSTSEVYGHNSVYGEPDILEQNCVYGLTKLAAEGVVKHYCDTANLKACSVRPFMVYGPGETPNGPYRSAVSNFLSTAHDGGQIQVHEGCTRSWCYIDDFCDAIALIVEKHDFDDYAAINVGTTDYRSMDECAELALGIVGRGTYEVKPCPATLLSPVKRADFSYITSLGFDPKVGAVEGMARTYAWMRANL